MAAMRAGGGAAWWAAAWLLTGALALGQQAQPAPAGSETGPEGAVASAEAALTASQLEQVLEQAKAALLDAEIEKAEQWAGQAVTALEQRESAAGGLADEERRKLAEALDVIAQCRFTLGDKTGATEAVERLIHADPSYEASGEIVGPKYVELFNERRMKLVGFLVPLCRPLPCETVLVDGAEIPLPGDGRLAVTAGSHRLRLERHGFEPTTLDEVEVAAGESKNLEAELEQVARDIAFRTVPADVDVSLDGTPVGKTVAESGGEAGGGFTLLNVAPGSHVIVLHRACYQRLEHRVEVVLDALHPEPLDLGKVELLPARAVLEIDWPRAEGVLALDSRPVKPGEHEVCPGSYEVSLSFGDKLVWREKLTLHDDETRKVSPRPRPSLVLIGREGVDSAGAGGDAWNLLLPPDEGEGVSRFVAELSAKWSSSGASVPLYPTFVRGNQESLGKSAQSLFPGADLVAAWIEGGEAVRPTRRLVLLLPSQGVIEATAWRVDDESGAAEGLAAILAGASSVRAGEAAAASPMRAYLGIDVAGRRDGPPVITQVGESCPIEGAGPGQLLLQVGDQPIGDAAAFENALAAIEPGGSVDLAVQDAQGRRELKGTALTQIPSSAPSALTRSMLLPGLATALATRQFGKGTERLEATLRAGMMFAALGEDRSAAALLDRAEIQADLDPSQDVRGTVWKTLEDLMNRLGSKDYAAEVRARWQALHDARFGGRSGPPLRLLQ